MKKKMLLAVLCGISVTLGGCGVRETEGRVTRVVQEQVSDAEAYQMEATVPKLSGNDGAVSTAEIYGQSEAAQTEVQTEPQKPSEAAAQTEAQLDEYGRISQERVIAIVLSKVPGATASDVYIELEMDDGYWEYEGEIHYNFREYEFEINAMNGKILEWSEDD